MVGVDMGITLTHGLIYQADSLYILNHDVTRWLLLVYLLLQLFQVQVELFLLIRWLISS